MREREESGEGHHFPIGPQENTSEIPCKCECWLPQTREKKLLLLEKGSSEEFGTHPDVPFHFLDWPVSAPT